MNNNWISVKKQIPIEQVLCINEDEDYFCEDDNQRLQNVTHFMPLPELPTIQ